MATFTKKPSSRVKNIHLFTYANAIDIKTNDNISSVNHVVVKNYAGRNILLKQSTL